MVKTAIRRAKMMVPPVDPLSIPRHRLAPMLDQVAMLPLTVVRAPTGFGKTSAVADWVRAQDRRMAWYSLDESDNAFDSFVAGIANALRDADPDIGSSLLANFQFDRVVSPVDCAAWLDDDLAESTHDLTLVIDDLQLIDEPDIALFLREFLRYPRPSLHVVILTQSALPFDIEPMRRRGQVGEVGVRDLAYTEAEAREYLRHWPAAPLPDQTIDDLVGVADGWISALKMGALALATSTPDAAPKDSPGWGQRRLGESLEALCDDLLQHWTPEFLAFMVAIATPDRVSPALADAIAAELPPGQRASARLRAISDAGLFLLPDGSSGEWYRFHGLFRQALLQHADTSISAEQRRALNRRIGMWYGEHGDISAAVRHLLAADDTDAATGFVVQSVQGALAFDQWVQIEQWLRQLPEATVGANVDLLIARAWTLQARGRHDALAGVLALARTLSDHRDPVEQEADQAELGLLETFARALRVISPEEQFAAYRRAFEVLQGTGRFGELVAIQYYPLALSRVNTDDANALIDEVLAHNAGHRDPFAQFRVFWARVAQLMIYGSIGNATVMLDLSRMILSQAVKLGAQRQIALGQFLVASVLYEVDELEEAERLFRAVVSNSHTGIRVLVGSETRLAYTLDALGRPDEADDLLQRSLDRLLDADALDFVATVRTAELRLAISRGDTLRSERLVEALDRRHYADYATEIEIPSFAVSLNLIHAGSPADLERADGILSALESDLSHVHWRSARVQIIAVRALWNARQGKHAEADRLLAEAISMAEHAGYSRTFTRLGPVGADTLQRYRDGHGPWPFLDETLARMRVERHGRTTPMPHPITQTSILSRSAGLAGDVPIYVEPMTQRELDILHGLQARFTNKEIAEALSISPLTVKSHTRNIYGKLGVNGRRQAIVRASALGLLSQSFPPDR